MSFEARRAQQWQIAESTRQAETARQAELERRMIPIRQDIARRIASNPLYIQIINSLHNPQLAQYLRELWDFWIPDKSGWEVEKEIEYSEDEVHSSLFGKRKTGRKIWKSRKVKQMKYPPQFNPVLTYPLDPVEFANGLSLERLQQEFGENLDTIHPDRLEFLARIYFQRKRHRDEYEANQRYDYGKGGRSWGGVKNKAIDEQQKKDAFGIRYFTNPDDPKIVLSSHDGRNLAEGETYYYRSLEINVPYDENGVYFNLEETMNNIAREANGKNFEKSEYAPYSP